VTDTPTRTVERALSLLAAVCDRRGANLADCARDCDLPPSTALRILRTLERPGSWPRSSRAAIDPVAGSSNSAPRLCPTSR
jgi:IclR helix-turn-helix domain